MLSNYLKQNQQILKIRFQQFADFDGQYVTRKTSHTYKCYHNNYRNTFWSRARWNHDVIICIVDHRQPKHKNGLYKRDQNIKKCRKTPKKRLSELRSILRVIQTVIKMCCNEYLLNFCMYYFFSKSSKETTHAQLKSSAWAACVSISNFQIVPEVTSIRTISYRLMGKRYHQ
jgi:hypothetical protein